MSKDKLLSDEELATKLIRIAKGIGKTYDDSIDAKLEQSILNLINTQKRLYAESEKLKDLNRVHFEPLIKDEKVRKAVRAWAEANGYGKDEVYEFEDFSTGWKSWSLEHKVNGDDNEIHFNGGIDFDKVEHQGYYTIDELCGEEE
jgi:hypothetical protein